METQTHTNTTTYSGNSAAQSMEVLMSGSSSLLAIRIAKREGTLRLEVRNGRFGKFVAICDGHGTIEVADTMAEAKQTVALA